MQLFDAVRQYLQEGYFPTGSPNPDDTIEPSSALLKAMAIHSAIPMTARWGEEIPSLSSRLLQLVVAVL